MIVLKDTNIHMTDAKTVAKVFQDLLAVEDVIDQDKEHFYVMHLNIRHKVKMVELVAIGSLTATTVHPRETFRRAVIEGSARIVVGHNHPGGEVSPSEQDIACTRRLYEVGQILDIQLLDHIIFTKDAYHSMKDNGGV